MPISLQLGHATHVGLERATNEDSYLVLTPPGVSPPVDGLLLVADGVGGTNAGEVASGVLVDAFRGWFVDNTYPQQVHYNPANPDYFIAALKDLLENANERLYRLAATRPEWNHMGTTATAALFSGNRVYVGHVGDTRAYLLRGGVLQHLTADHSWVAEEVAAGRMTEAEAQNHPRRNVISRVLGNHLLLRVDRPAYEVLPNDIYILTSDGLTGLVSDEEIRATVLAARSFPEACGQLIALANRAGGHDNITVIIARVLPDGQRGDGAGPGGVAVQSVYLGQGAPQPTPPRPARPAPASASTRAGVTAVLTQPPPAPAPATQPKAAPRRARRGRWVGWVLLLLAVLGAGAALSLGAARAAADRAVMIGQQAIDPPIVVGLLVALAIVIGFILGYFGHRWLAEGHDS